MSRRSTFLSHAVRGNGKRKHQLALVFLATIGLANHAMGQDVQPLYAAGRFPDGPRYAETDLRDLAGRSFTSPTYLMGHFVYVGNVRGMELFSSFTAPSDGSISFGKTLIAVKFFNNCPPELTRGKTIVATAENPLTVRNVTVSRDGSGLILVSAESWSEAR